MVVLYARRTLESRPVARPTRVFRGRRAPSADRIGYRDRARRARGRLESRTLCEKPPCANDRTRGRAQALNATSRRRRRDVAESRIVRARARHSTSRARSRTTVHATPTDARRFRTSRARARRRARRSPNTANARLETRPGTRSHRAAEFLDVPSERVFEDDARCLPRRRRT